MPPPKDAERLAKVETQFDFILAALGELKTTMGQTVSKIDFDQFRTDIMAAMNNQHNSLTVRVDDVEKRTRDLEKQIWYWLGAIGVVSVLVSLAGGVLTAVVTSLILQAVTK